MKVLDLQCAHNHSFEGWFGSERDFSEQLERGLLTCPLCGDAHIRKMLSAPRLNLLSARDQAPVSTQVGDACPPEESAPAKDVSRLALQARWMHAVRQVYAQSEDVGDRFAEEARAMHQGEIDHRNIRGRASADEALSLIEEGVDVLPLPSMALLKETLQ